MYFLCCMKVNEASLIVIVSKDLIIKKINYIKKDFSAFDVYVGLSFRDIFGNQKLSKIETAVYKQHSDEVICVCLLSSLY